MAFEIYIKPVHIFIYVFIQNYVYSLSFCMCIEREWEWSIFVSVNSTLVRGGEIILEGKAGSLGPGFMN